MHPDYELTLRTIEEMTRLAALFESSGDIHQSKGHIGKPSFSAEFWACVIVIADFSHELAHLMSYCLSVFDYITTELYEDSTRLDIDINEG